MTEEKAGSITKNFDITLEDKAEGMPVIWNGKPLSALRAIQTAFFNPITSDQNDPDGAKERYKIGMKMMGGGDIDFTPEELTAIRHRIRRFWPASQVSGQIEDIIDKKD